MLEEIQIIKNSELDSEEMSNAKAKIISSIETAINTPEFYSLDLNHLRNIVSQSHPLKLDSIKTLLKKTAESFGDLSFSILPHIKCDIQGDEILDIFQELNASPIISEAIKVITSKNDTIVLLEKERDELINELDEVNSGFDFDFEKYYQDELEKNSKLQQQIEVLKENQLPSMTIFDAIRNMDFNKAKEIVNNDPTAVTQMDKSDNAMYPICIAAKIGWLDGVKLFIENGAQINMPPIQPIIWAAANNRIDILKFLIGKGADPNTKTKNGLAPLHLAAIRDYYNIAKELIVQGANVNLKDIQGKTPLTFSKHYLHRSISQLLQEHGGTE